MTSERTTAEPHGLIDEKSGIRDAKQSDYSSRNDSIKTKQRIKEKDGLLSAMLYLECG